MKDQTLVKLLKVALVVGGVSVLAPVVNAQGIGARQLQNMLVPTPQKVERGKALYQQNCATCHGKDGHGMSGVKLAGTPGQSFQTVDFTKANYRWAKGAIQMYDTITFGIADALPGPVPEGQTVPAHPLYQYMQYQSRWDLVHYVRSLGPTKGLTDPPAIIAKAKDRAENGVCQPDIKSSIAAKVKPKGDEQLKHGGELFAQNCTSCHGPKGLGNGPAAASLTPKPRNFHTKDVKEWTNEPSALSIFSTLTNGVAGTSMPSFANLPEKDRWALVQWILHWVPDSVEVKSGEKQIVAACRALSAPEKPASIPVAAAMKAMIKDQAEDRLVRLAEFGTVELSPNADPHRGQQVYVQNCVSCHGVGGAGLRKGPYGAQPPYFYIKMDRLVPAMAGGNAGEFAARSYGGVHASLRSMRSAALLSKQQWRDLQAYVATFEGEGEITVQSPESVQPAQGAQGAQAPAGEAAPAQAGQASPQPAGAQPKPGPANKPAPSAQPTGGPQ